MEISTSSRALTQNKTVNLKIAGRFRQVPLWATNLSFEVRPNDRFDNRAWKLWKPTLLLMNQVVKKERIQIKWVRVHSHFNLRGELPHAMGWMDPESKGLFLCHFDKETMLHELGHAKSIGYHGDQWAKNTWKLYDRYLAGQELNTARKNLCQYLSGRRQFKKVLAKKPPKFSDQKSIWWHRKPK